MGTINDILARHQQAEAWQYRDLAAALHVWAERFAVQFKLDIPKVILRLARLNRQCYGHFAPFHNDFGLAREIAINLHYVGEEKRPFWQVLRTLLHEQIHLWQHLHGEPGSGGRWHYHNAEFRRKAEVCGIIVNPRGVTEGEVPDGPFVRLLAEHGVHVPEIPLPARGREAGTSKLKKWSCGCTNVRVAVARFRARCLNCGREFALENR